jgi:hydroxymethylpyrimidine/phosphomethylpyrimidine kinase
MQRRQPDCLIVSGHDSFGGGGSETDAHARIDVEQFLAQH